MSGTGWREAGHPAGIMWNCVRHQIPRFPPDLEGIQSRLWPEYQRDQLSRVLRRQGRRAARAWYNSFVLIIQTPGSYFPHLLRLDTLRTKSEPCAFRCLRTGPQFSRAMQTLPAGEASDCFKVLRRRKRYCMCGNRGLVLVRRLMP